MLKKFTAILMMYFAYAILLGHAIIPHHHHEDELELTEHVDAHHHHAIDSHHQDDPHQDQGNHEDGLHHLFSHFLHSADDYTSRSTQNSSITFLKTPFSFVAILVKKFAMDEFLIPPLLHPSPKNFTLFFSTHALSSGLRAPPALLL